VNLEKPSPSLFSQTLPDEVDIVKGGQMILVPQKTGKTACPFPIALDLTN